MTQSRKRYVCEARESPEHMQFAYVKYRDYIKSRSRSYILIHLKNQTRYAYMKWVSMRKNLSSGFANNIDADQRFCSSLLESIICKPAKSKFSASLGS